MGDEGNVVPKPPALEDVLPTGVPVPLAGSGGRLSTKVEPKLEDGLNGLIVLPANPVGCGCKGFEEPPKAEALGVPTLACGDVTPVACPVNSLPDEKPVLKAVRPLPKAVGLFASLFEDKANAEANSDMAVPDGPLPVPDTVLF